MYLHPTLIHASALVDVDSNPCWEILKNFLWKISSGGNIRMVSSRLRHGLRRSVLVDSSAGLHVKDRHCVGLIDMDLRENPSRFMNSLRCR